MALSSPRNDAMAGRTDAAPENDAMAGRNDASMEDVNRFGDAAPENDAMVGRTELVQTEHFKHRAEWRRQWRLLTFAQRFGHAFTQRFGHGHRLLVCEGCHMAFVHRFAVTTCHRFAQISACQGRWPANEAMEASSCSPRLDSAAPFQPLKYSRHGSWRRDFCPLGLIQFSLWSRLQT